MCVCVCRWGFTSTSGELADVLQMVELLPVPLKECREQYEDGIITENMICAAATDKDSCFVSPSFIFTFITRDTNFHELKKIICSVNKTDR